VEVRAHRAGAPSLGSCAGSPRRRRARERPDTVSAQSPTPEGEVELPLTLESSHCARVIRLCTRCSHLGREWSRARNRDEFAVDAHGGTTRREVKVTPFHLHHALEQRVDSRRASSVAPFGASFARRPRFAAKVVVSHPIPHPSVHVTHGAAKSPRSPAATVKASLSYWYRHEGTTVKHASSASCAWE